MGSLQALLLMATLTGVGETVLLDFYAPSCGPCQGMVPTVRRLEADGLPVRPVNVQQEVELARRFGVTAVPCFVMLADGREVDRVLGATSYDRLKQMFERARPRPPGGADVRGQSPDSGSGRQAQGVSEGRAMFAATARAMPAAVARASGAAPGQAPADAALRATVRLRVEDNQGTSFGTGTIIHTHGEEALVITCGHIFRSSQGKGQINVDMFGPDGVQTRPGHVIAYDAEQRDIGLISFRPGRAVQSVPVAPRDFRVFRQDRVFSVGCDRGKPPTVRHSHVTALNKYLGAPNVEVKGQPVDGRSGGGLFSAAGHLIGICNAADPQDDEGIYAALDTIHWQLRIFPADSMIASAAAPGTTAAVLPQVPSPVAQSPVAQSPVAQSPVAQSPVAQSPVAQSPVAQSPVAQSPVAQSPVAQSPVAPAAADLTTLANLLGDGRNQAEVICIVRPRDGQPGEKRIVVLDRLAPEVVQQLVRQYGVKVGGHAMAEAAAETAAAARDAAQAVIRGQSADNLATRRR